MKIKAPVMSNINNISPQFFSLTGKNIESVMKYYFNWAKIFCLRVNHNIQHYILDGIYESYSVHNNFTLTSPQGTIEMQGYLNVILETNMFFHLHNVLRLNLNIQYIY